MEHLGSSTSERNLETLVVKVKLTRRGAWQFSFNARSDEEPEERIEKKRVLYKSMRSREGVHHTITVQRKRMTV